jgi:hypothetical protein
VIDLEMSIDAFMELCKLHQVIPNTEKDLFCLPCLVAPLQGSKEGNELFSTCSVTTEDAGSQIRNEVEDYSIKQLSQLDGSDDFEADECNKNPISMKRKWKKRFYGLYQPIFVQKKIAI